MVSETPQKRNRLPWLLLIAGLLLSLVAANQVRQDILEEESARAAAAADQIALKIRERLESQELVLRGAAGLFNSGARIDRNVWKNFVEGLQPETIVPGMQGLGFSEWIEPQQLEAHEKRVREEGFPLYRVTPPDSRDAYTAIVFLEPFSERNVRAFGFDMYSEPVRRAAMSEARDSGQATLSGKVKLVQETDDGVQAGTLMYFPVYRPGMATDTLHQRRAALIGWAYSPFRMIDLMDAALKNWGAQLGKDWNLALYDGDLAEPEALLYSTTNATLKHVEHPLHHHRSIQFKDKRWLMALDRAGTLSQGSFLPAWLTLAGGSIISTLLCWLALSITGTQQRAERLAAQLTQDIRSKDQLLRESEYRWNFALEGSDLGVWDWNVAESKVFFSRRWKEMLGYAEHEIGNDLTEWSGRVHPDDLDSVMTAVKDHLEGRSPAYSNEHRVRCKDGSYKWIHDRGMVVERDGDGRPLRMIGTHSDITEATQSALQLHSAVEESRRLREALDNVSAYIYMKDAESRYVYANKPTLQLFGLTAEELAGSSDDRLFPKDTAERLREIDQRVLAGENTHEEIDVLTPAGQRIYLEVKTPIYADAERRTLWGLCGISTDITELKQLNEALHRNQNDLKEAQRIARTGSWQLEVATGAVTWTEALYRMFGLDPQEPPPAFNRQIQLFSPGSWERLNTALTQTIGEGIPYELELECITAEGEKRWMLANGEAMRDAGGKVSAVRGTATDITERKMAELQILRLNQLYAALSESNAAVTRCSREQELFHRLCEVIVELGGLSMAWIGITDTAGNIVPAAAHGSGAEYLDGIRITINADDPHGRGPTGTAARENRPVWIDDFRTSDLTTPWQQRASPYNWNSSVALPIRRNGIPIGALTIYSTESGGWQNQQTRDLIEKIAAAIDLALDRFAANEAAARYQATLVESEQRFRTLVEQSVAGSFIVQNETLIYVNPRFAQIFGYDSGDELRGRRTRDLIAAKDRAMFESASRKFHGSETEKIDLSFTGLRKDGDTIDVGMSVCKVTYNAQPALIGLIQDISDKKVAEDQIRRYANQLEHAFMQMVSLATTLSEMRDAYTAGHEKRVAEIAVAIGREMGMPEDRLEGLRVCGYLHDVGKVSIPSEILAKPGRLSPIEFELIKTHAKAGHEVLKDIEFPWPVAEVALQHHERMDGKGYPQGLKGDDIILEARIVAVADVVESMASHRPYRPALGLDKALAEIESGAGKIYDADAARACLRLFREKKFLLPDQ